MKENKNINIQSEGMTSSLLNGKLFKFKKGANNTRKFGEEAKGLFNSLINLEPE